MRGGAIPLLLWGTGLLVLLAINGIWTKDAIQVGMLGFAVGVIYAAAAGLWLARRDALRKGAPRPRAELEAAPSISLAALGLGLSTGAMLFGAVFGKFLVYIGGGIWLLSLGRLAVEVRAQRRSVRGERPR